jgi:CelD/BcsL family acetyltransferase involved in cellulose biosynthesis
MKKVWTGPEIGTNRKPVLEEGNPILVEVIPGRELTPELMRAWRVLQETNPDLASPCFAPEFTQAVASVREDVEVALVRRNGELEAILPFQRKHDSVGTPVGGIVSDYQGLVARPGFICNPLELIKSCNLFCWNFDRLLASQALFAPFHDFCEPSAIIDVSQGFEAYAVGRRSAGSEQIKKCNNLLRRLEREVAPLRFVIHSPDPALLSQVLAWKSRQYLESGWHDLFAVRWARGLAESIQATQSESFAGLLSLLYAGERLVAGHLGMRSRTVWHYWFPAYDRDFAKYSPGLLLLLKMAQYAQSLGLRTIDLGTGISLYKKRLMNASIPVAEGSVEQPAWLRLRRQARRRLKSMLGLGFARKALSAYLLTEPTLPIL